MPVLDELIATTIDCIDVDGYDDQNVHVTVYLQTETSFKAMNHTSRRIGPVVLEIVASAEIPVVLESEDTERLVLEDDSDFKYSSHKQ